MMVCSSYSLRRKAGRNVLVAKCTWKKSRVVFTSLVAAAMNSATDVDQNGLHLMSAKSRKLLEELEAGDA